MSMVIDKNGVHCKGAIPISFMPLDFPCVHQYEVKHLKSGKYALHRFLLEKPIEEALIKTGWWSRKWVSIIHIYCGYNYYTFNTRDEVIKFAQNLKREEASTLSDRIARYAAEFNKEPDWV